MDAREKLIEMGQVNGMTYEDWADFILADRRRILQPLVKRRKDIKIPAHTLKAIKETLKNAGVE